MANVDDAVIARLDVGGSHFEILVDCDKAIDYKAGKAELEEVTVTNEVFADVKQGERASETDLEAAFETTEFTKIAERIIKKGEIQLTTEHRKRMREEKKKKIIHLIHRNAIDAKTGLPHPPQRIEAAMEQAKVKIDEIKKAEEQIQDIVTALRPIMPIKFEIWELAVKIPAEYAGQSFRTLKEFGKLLNEEWQNDGSLVAMIQLPAGLSEEFENKLNKITKGESEIRIVKKE